MDKILVAIISRLPKFITTRFAHDKIKHFIMGAVIALPFAVFGFEFLGLLASIVVGIGKEMVDDWKNNKLLAQGELPAHGVEFEDAVATALGGFVIWLIAVVL
jgi:hypothetical protein